MQLLERYILPDINIVSIGKLLIEVIKENNNDKYFYEMLFSLRVTVHIHNNKF